MKNRIGMNDFAAEYRQTRKKLLVKLDTFFLSGEYILGPNTRLFEQSFARHVGSRYCVGVANGLEAIQIALMGLGIGKGDEVITVSNSDVATALAILYVGATPVFVDIDEYFHMDPDVLERCITKRTKAILPVHLFGQTVNMDAIMHVAKKHGLIVVEDACQAHGATYRGRKAGSMGLVGCFSFYPTKNLGAAGDAGAIVTSSASLYKKFSMLRNRGASKRCVHPLRGLNSRLDELQAVILREKLLSLEKMNDRRRAIALRYRKSLSDVPEIVLPMERKHARHVYHQFVIMAARRQALMRYLSVHAIDTLVHYPTPIHLQGSFREFHFVKLAQTEKYRHHILSLPIHPYMTEAQVGLVIQHVRRFYKNTR